MNELTLLAEGFSVAVTPTNLLFVLIGVVLGQIFGALPGIGPSAGMALLLPLTFGLEPVTAIVMLAGIMYGGMYGNTLTSVLINLPGDAASVMTAYEGNKIARAGRAGAALSIAAIGSFLAGTTAVALLVFITPALANFALRFSAPEFFLLATLGISAAAVMGTGSTIKALIAAVLGLMIALVGTDPMAGTARLTFGYIQLLDGIAFLPVIIGLFGIGEILAQLERRQELAPIKARLRDMWFTAEEWKDSRSAMGVGGTVGFIVGLMPGAGPTVAALLAYAAQRALSKKPQRFGQGAIDGVAASESANNAAVHGALVPMLALGIPGSASTAVLLAALILQGIRPGPLLMAEQPMLVWGLIASMFIGNLILIVMNLPLAPAFAALLRIPYTYLAPGIVVMALFGAYSTTQDIFTVGVTLVFGMVGYLMIKTDIPRGPLVLAVVLAPILEMSLRQALTMARGSPMIFVQRPIAAILLAGVLAVYALPIVQALRRGRMRRVAPAAGAE